MSALPKLIHDGALAAGIGTVVWSATVTTAVLTALFASTSKRRRDARAVLAILLGRRPTDHTRPRRVVRRTADSRAHDLGH